MLGWGLIIFSVCRRKFLLLLLSSALVTGKLLELGALRDECSNGPFQNRIWKLLQGHGLDTAYLLGDFSTNIYKLLGLKGNHERNENMFTAGY